MVVGFGVVGGTLVVILVVGLMVVGAGLVVVVWVVVGGAVGGWVGAGLLSVLDGSCPMVEGLGVLVGEVLVVGSWSKISKSSGALADRLAVKERNER